jgi:hypothetical protein
MNFKNINKNLVTMVYLTRTRWKTLQDFCFSSVSKYIAIKESK